MKPLVNDACDPLQLSNRAAKAVADRLCSHSAYTALEISKIETIDLRILPEGGVISAESLERLRALARLSRTSLLSPERIQSHRKYTGWIIVAIKRAVLPFLRAQLKGTLDAQEEYNSLLLETLIRDYSGNMPPTTCRKQMSGEIIT